MFLTTRTYHGSYPDVTGRGRVSVLDQQICLEGLQTLIARGVTGKGHGSNGQIDKTDIVDVFTSLGGGSMYKMSDGRTVLRWWEQGSSDITQGKSFDLRLKEFNDKIKFKRENKVDSAELFLERHQKIAYDRFWDLASEQAKDYYSLSRMQAYSISKYLSIPDSDLMRRIFPEQLTIYDFI